jgi:hypothetical protein
LNSTHPSKVRASGLDMKIEQIEHDPIRQIPKAFVVDYESFSRVDHLSRS